MLATLLAVVLLPIPLVAQAQTRGPRESRRFPVGDLLRTRQQDPIRLVPKWGPASERDQRSWSPRLQLGYSLVEYETNESPFVSPKILLQAATLGIGPFAHPPQITGDVLTARAEPAVLDRLASRIRWLRATVATPVEYEVAIYSDASDGFVGVRRVDLDRAEDRMKELRDLPARLEQHGRTRSRPEELVHIGQMSSRAYVYDYNVGIAADSAIADPVVMDARYGTAMSLVSEIIPGGAGLAVSFSLICRTVPDAVDSINVASKSIDTIDRVEMTESRLTGSIVLPGTGAFEVAPGGALRPDLRALVIVHRPKPVELSETNLTVVPLAFFRESAAARTLSILADQYNPYGRPIEEIVRAFTPVAADAGPMKAFEHTDDHLLIADTPAGFARTRARIAELSRSRARSFVVELGRELADGAQAEPPVCIPVLAFREGAAIVGNAQTYVFELNSEVANKAKMDDVTPQFAFSGTKAHVVVAPETAAPDAKLHVELALGVSVLRALRQVHIGKNRPYIEAPQLDRIAFSRRLSLTPGQRQLLGTGLDRRDDRGRMAKTRMWIRVDELK